VANRRPFDMCFGTVYLFDACQRSRDSWRATQPSQLPTPAATRADHRTIELRRHPHGVREEREHHQTGPSNFNYLQPNIAVSDTLNYACENEYCLHATVLTTKNAYKVIMTADTTCFSDQCDSHMNRIPVTRPTAIPLLSPSRPSSRIPLQSKSLPRSQLREVPHQDSTKWVRDSIVRDSISRTINTDSLYRTWRRMLHAPDPVPLMGLIYCEGARLAWRYGTIPSLAASERMEDTL